MDAACEHEPEKPFGLVNLTFRYHLQVPVVLTNKWSATGTNLAKLIRAHKQSLKNVELNLLCKEVCLALGECTRVEVSTQIHLTDLSRLHVLFYSRILVPPNLENQRKRVETKLNSMFSGISTTLMSLIFFSVYALFISMPLQIDLGVVQNLTRACRFNLQHHIARTAATFSPKTCLILLCRNYGSIVG